MMPTRKKVLPKNSSREHSNPRTGRGEKKINMVSEKKVSELITSAKKPKSVGITSKQNICAKTERTTGLDNCVSQNENQSSRSFSVKDLSHDTTANCMSEIIFSPAFHHHKDNAAGIPDKDSKIKNNESHRGFEVEGSKYGSFNSVTLETHDEHMKIRNVVCENSGNLALHEASGMDNSGSHIYNIGPKLAKLLCNDEYTDLGNLSCEVSAVYLAS